MALTVSAPGLKDSKGDPSKLEGDWVAESYVLGGKDDGREKGEVFRFADGKITVVGHREALEYKLDVKAVPGRIEMAPVGRPAEPVIQGIYKVDDDALVLCFPKGGGAERPTKFESPAGSQIVLLTLKRARKKD